MSLKDLLEPSNNSMTSYREKLVEHQFILDIMIEMGKLGHAVDIMTTRTADMFGYDILLLHKSKRRLIQLKSKRSDATTNDWDISEFFIKNNREGEFILAVIDYSNEFKVAYKVLQRNSRTGLVPKNGKVNIKESQLSELKTAESLVNYLFFPKKR